MTRDELIAKLPDEAKEIGILYGDQVIAMGVEDAKAWLNFVFLGKYIEAYKLFLKAADTDLLAEWGKVEADWQAANEKNAAKYALSLKIAEATAKALLSLVLAMVGL